MREVAALVPYGPEAASVRFRVTQYAAALAERGYALRLLPFFSPEEAAEAWRGRTASAARAGLAGLRRRLHDVRSRVGDADLALVHRELTPVLGRLVLGRLLAAGRPLVYDVDDAVFLPQPGSRTLAGLLRRPGAATRRLCRAAAATLAGNDYLADFARRSGGRPVLLPTTVDVARYRPGPPPERARIAWIGSASTEAYLRPVLERLRRAALDAGGEVLIVSEPARAGERAPEGVRRIPWRLDEEPLRYRDATVGVYPLPDDAWTRGKCGLKALLFLASGVPVVASPVGVLRRIVRPGENGWWAEDGEAWSRRVADLLGDPEARRGLAEGARATVLSGYRLDEGADTLARTFDRVLDGRVG